MSTPAPPQTSAWRPPPATRGHRQGAPAPRYVPPPPPPPPPPTSSLGRRPWPASPSGRRAAATPQAPGGGPGPDAPNAAAEYAFVNCQARTAPCAKARTAAPA
eukprot:TRINITY_DN12077_c0_g1_i1.p2 TRINITY_DN12077_c0_g1~~TRINITY_DN12077_c0_g1_i1.p2  ORF type:complete len:103 (-),score=1.92 TRINITY_DN12077_c0_g1_i1:308-616(-)